jgi:hypothetical protein
MRILGLIFIFFLFGNLLNAQVVNIESRRVKLDTTGWYGEFNTGFKYLKERSPIFNFTNDARLQYKASKDLYLVLANYDIAKSKGKTLTNNAFFHFRYNRKINGFLRWEAFTQLQFNEITRVKNRWLLGTGARWKLLDKEVGAIYLGNAYMFEINQEKNLNDDIIRQIDNRLSNYLSFSIFPNDLISIISTTYYQPKINDWHDFRVSNVSDFRAKISKRLVIGMSYRLSYDSDPAEGIPTLNHSFENKLGIVF